MGYGTHPLEVLLLLDAGRGGRMSHRRLFVAHPYPLVLHGATRGLRLNVLLLATTYRQTNRGEYNEIATTLGHRCERLVHMVR